MACFVYVLRSSKDHRFYVGMTENLELRFAEHQAGKVRSTRGRRPLELMYSEPCNDRTSAAKKEKFLKSGAGHKILKSLLSLPVSLSSLK